MIYIIDEKELDKLFEHDKFHHEDKGCEMVETRENVKKSRYTVKSYYCKKHNVKCSKTGWEWGWFGGTRSQRSYECMLKKNKLNKLNKTINN